MLMVKVLTRDNPGVIAECCLKLLPFYGIERGESDILLSLQYDKIVPPEELARYRIALNLHNAKLPEYCGFNSLHWALANGEITYTSTLHWMVEKVDAGPIAYQSSVPILAGDTVQTLYGRTVSSCLYIVALFLRDVKYGIIPQMEQTGTRRYYHRDEMP